jgi:phenylacetate-CoA ligase
MPYPISARQFSRRIRADFRAAQERRQAPVRRPADIERLQLDAFGGVWADAVKDVPYYAALVHQGRAPREIRTTADLQAVPILTRKVIQDNPEAFVRRSHGPKAITYTAGSTGTPLRIGSDEPERRLLRVVKLASWQEYGYAPDSRLFLIWGHAHLLGGGWRGMTNRLVRSATDRFLGYRRGNAYRMDRESCAAIAEQIIGFRPAGVIGYAAALDLFARYSPQFRERFHRLGLKFVLTTTEAPPRADTAERLEDLFGCPAVQEYGGSDFGQVAFKRSHEPFEVYPDLNYVECEPGSADEPRVHPVLITTLYPRYVPLVRYRVGDGVIDPETLPHGHVSRFAEVAGRLTDVVDLGGGDSIHSLSIFHCVHEEAQVYNVQMRIADRGILIRLVVAAGADTAALEARLRPRLGRVHPALATAQFAYVDDLETNRAGKRRWCVDERTLTPPCAESPAS